MLLTITTAYTPASDLAFVLHKHLDRWRSFDLAFGKAHDDAGNLIKIGAKVLRRSKYVTFRMAEVAVPRELFAAILERIR